MDEQRASIKIKTSRSGTQAEEIHIALVEAFHEHVLAPRTVRNGQYGLAKVKTPSETTKDHIDHKHHVMSDMYTEAVDALLFLDRQITLKMCQRNWGLPLHPYAAFFPHTWDTGESLRKSALQAS